LNPEYEKKTRRTLEDVSHLFLSGVEQKKEKVSAPFILGVVDSLQECGFPLILSFAEKLERPPEEILLIDFHPPKPRAGESASGSFLPGKYHLIQVSPWEDWRRGAYCKQTKFVLLNIPWLTPQARDVVIPNLNGILFCLEPSLSSLKNTYRLLKGISESFNGRVFAFWKAGCTPEHLDSIASGWEDLVERFLEKKVEWVEGLESALSAIGPRDFGNFEFSLFESQSPAGDSLPFFEKGRLDWSEIEAFSGLVCQERFSVLFPRT